MISLLFAAGHTLGGRKSWSPIGDNEVLQAMRSFRFDAQGASRTYLDFYLGFGFCLSAYLLLQAALLWQLAKIAQDDPPLVRPLIASFLVAFLGLALVSWKFIFILPVAFFAVLAAILSAALLASWRRVDS